MKTMSTSPNYFEAKLNEARELGRREGWATTLQPIKYVIKNTREYADTEANPFRIASSGVLAWQKACNKVELCIDELITPQTWVELDYAPERIAANLETAYVQQIKEVAYKEAIQTLEKFAPDLFKQLSDRLEAYQEGYTILDNIKLSTDEEV
jgi:hypothetical protein